MSGELAEFPVVPQNAPPPVVPLKAMECFQQGMVHFQSGNAAEAVAAFSRTVELAPQFADGHVFLGIAYALTHNIYPAIDQLEEAAALDSDSFAAHFTLAQLSFKLRTPQNGYEASRKALRCVQTLEQRKMLTQLLKEERERERNGVARPSFLKPFSGPVLFFIGTALITAIIVVLAHMR